MRTGAWTGKVLTISATVMVAAGAAHPAAAVAARFDVTTTADAAATGATNDGVCAAAGGCTLRAAVQEANGTTGADEIVVPSGTFALDVGSALPLSSDVTLRGAGARSTTIKGVSANASIFVITAGAVTMTDVAITGGRSAAGAGVYLTAGSLNLQRAAVVGNTVTTGSTGYGGGIHVSGGELSLTDSTVAENKGNSTGLAAAGGGIYLANNTKLTAVNSTIHHNSASCMGCSSAYGGGISAGTGTPVSLTNVTVTANSIASTSAAQSGGNLYTQGGTTVRNSIFTEGSAAAAAAANCAVGPGGSLSAAGRNIESGPGTCTGFDHVDPQLSPLQDNGGQTDTRLPAVGSPAVDGASGCPPPAGDQRGNPRPLGAGCDVGATEYGADLALAMAADTAGPVPPGGTVRFSITATNLGADVATGVALTDTLPAGASLITALASTGACTGGAVQSCTLGDVPRGGSATVQVVVGAAAAPTLTNAASVAASPPDPNPANNAATLSLPGVGVVSVSGFSMLRTRFRVARAATPVSRAAARRPPRGSAFRFTLSQAASVAIRIERALPGRRSGRRCVRPTRANRRRARCTRHVAAGTLRRRGAAGRNSVAFTGRIGRRALKPGRHRATLTARAGGRTSAPRRVSFTIVAG